MEFSTTFAQLKCIKHNMSSNLADLKYNSLVYKSTIAVYYIFYEVHKYANVFVVHFAKNTFKIHFRHNVKKYALCN